MFALRYAGLLAIAVWLGGIVALGGLAAPAVFDVLAARGIADDRVVSGAIVGEMLRRFHHLGYACGGVFLLSLIARAVLGPRPRRFAVRAGIGSLMLVVSVYTGIVVHGRIEALRQEIGVSPSSLPESDPRRDAFGRLHGWSTALQLVPFVGGLALLRWELGD